jgi:hypothetical protein
MTSLLDGYLIERAHEPSLSSGKPVFIAISEAASYLMSMQ